MYLKHFNIYLSSKYHFIDGKNTGQSLTFVRTDIDNCECKSEEHSIRRRLQEGMQVGTEEGTAVSSIQRQYITAVSSIQQYSVSNGSIQLRETISTVFAFSVGR